MSCDEVFVEYLLELLSPLGEVTTKRMFGGVGFFRDTLMFALVADSALYIKVDDENLADFEALDLEPFVFEKTNKNVTMSYYQAPEEAFEDSESMCRWSESGIKAAERAVRKKDQAKKQAAKAVADSKQQETQPGASSAPTDRQQRALEEDIDDLVSDTDDDGLSLDHELA